MHIRFWIEAKEPMDGLGCQRPGRVGPRRFIMGMAAVLLI
jgi:hypothetical protein